MTPEERCDEIAKALYMGEIPDFWEAIAKVLITQHIRGAEKVAFEFCADLCMKDAQRVERLCMDPYHDDRYCSTCESMRDEADMLEQRIRGLTLP